MRTDFVRQIAPSSPKIRRSDPYKYGFLYISIGYYELEGMNCQDMRHRGGSNTVKLSFTDCGGMQKAALLLPLKRVDHIHGLDLP